MQPNYLDMAIGKLRLKDIKYAAISDRTGLDVPYLSRIFNGSQKISEATIERFAEMLNCSRVEAYKQIEELRKLKRQNKEANQCN
jgi:transcriptional regulator with XRE-family HTH domain